MKKVQEPFTSIPLSNIGNVVDGTIGDIPNHYQNVVIDAYVVMPNHIHLLITLVETENPLNEPSRVNPPTISQIINQMKGVVTKKVGWSIWQKLFYDHIVRNDEEYGAYMDYIEANPVNWMDDKKFGS